MATHLKTMELWGISKVLLNQTPVKKDPKKDVNACQDFLLTVVKGHLLAAACTYLGVHKLDSPLKLPLDIYKKSNAEQYTFLEKIATQVVNNLTVVESALTGGHVVQSGDGVYNYTGIVPLWCTSDGVSRCLA